MGPNHPDSKQLSRPALGTRKSSSTNIVPRDDPRVEIQEGEESFDPDDARAMSPRRNSEDLEKMYQDSREELSRLFYLLIFSHCLGAASTVLTVHSANKERHNRHAKKLHDSLLKIVNRLARVKEEHDKLENNNEFLQKYIGDLMSTAKDHCRGGE
jgi:hypothetical protein